nr:bifunctional 2',3'-cyclic-nucleotide 2'-phosphodiesterase/3'-nucleotidase [Metabacillus lacus]
MAKAETSSSNTLKIKILETTDIHMSLNDYNYFSDEASKVGLVRVATLVKEQRALNGNTLLFDNGDIIQGNPLGDYVAVENPITKDETHPAITLMNEMKFDAAALGNHEFNYGLDYLDLVYSKANFPYLSANVEKAGSPGTPKYKPYEILDRTFKDENGNNVNLKVGVIGVVAPQIMQWDKAHLEGKVDTFSAVTAAERYVPQMKNEGADIIVVLSHGGLDPKELQSEENQVYELSKVKGIDAILFGHTHNTFPSANFKDVPNVDVTKGTINGVAGVQAGVDGSHLGLIDMTLEKTDNGKWTVKNSQSSALPVSDVKADAELSAKIKNYHDAAVAYVNQPVGKTSSRIHSYFARVQDDPSIQIVTNAQKEYVEREIQKTNYKDLPVLSAGAPFKAGRNGADDYTFFEAGNIAIKNVADLYKYSNTVAAAKLTGAQVKEWLEWSAVQFNQIDPAKTEEQALINPDFPAFNFDVIDGVTYEIDVTQPARYNVAGTEIVNPAANRIKNLQFDGKPINLQQEFIVATNNYRANSKIANPDGNNIIASYPDENRQVVINYIIEKKNIDPAADNNWRFSAITSPVNVTFNSSPKAKDLLADYKNIQYAGEGTNNFAKYTVNFSRAEEKPGRVLPEVKVKEPIARAIIKKAVEIVKIDKDGKETKYKTALPGEALRVFGHNNGLINVGGDYYIKNDRNFVSLYSGRVLIRENRNMFTPDGKLHRVLQKGEAVKTYEIQSDRYQVGGGYYVLYNKNAVYFEGMVKMNADTALMDASGKVSRQLKKGEQYRVYGVEGNKLMVGGGYYIVADKSKVAYSKN